MAWKIDRDYLAEADEQTAVGIGQGEPSGETFRFRLLDDDGIPYYGGRADQSAADADMADGGLYQALRWATADAGCTSLELHTSDALRLGLTDQTYVDRRELKPSDWVSIYG